MVGQSERANGDAASAVVWATSANIFWGLTPVFWKMLSPVSPREILAQRVLWSALFLVPAFSSRKYRSELARFIRQGQAQWLSLAVGALLMACNWYLYVLAISQHRLLESSLGYFLAPLGTVALGIGFRGETLQGYQKAALALSLAAVVVLAAAVGGVPSLVLGIAGSLSLYSLVKKRVALSAILSVALECLILSPGMALYLASLGAGPHSPSAWGLLVLSGPVTAIPLVLYAKALPQARLILLGFLFYLTPALQFVLAAAVYREPISGAQALAVCLVVTAVGIIFAGRSRDSAHQTRAGAASVP